MGILDGYTIRKFVNEELIFCAKVNKIVRNKIFMTINWGNK